MNGRNIEDSKISVQMKGANRDGSRDRTRGPTAKDVCYNCGKSGHW